MSNQISEGDIKEWDRGNSVNNKIIAEMFTKLLDRKPQTQEAQGIQTG